MPLPLCHKKYSKELMFMDEAFGRYHPAINFIFFIGSIIFGMFFVHPIFLALSVFFSLLYYLLLKRTKGLRFLIGMLVFFVLISGLNPFFNMHGDTVLFTYFNGRYFTLEALYYGFATGSMFLSVILWFACYNTIMTSDKFIYLFGRFIPSISLVLCMVLQLVPKFKAKLMVISGARKCIGKSPESGNKSEKLQNGMTILSVLTSWALEGGVVTADSMKSRGYGSGRRSSFTIYRLEARDWFVFSLMLSCIAFVIFSMINGSMRVRYIPTLDIPKVNGYTIIGIIGYSIFLFIPSIIHIWEETIWHILRSKI